MRRLGSGESKLETLISYLLIVGVAVSLILEAAGIILFYRSQGHLDISQDEAAYIHGQNFFSFLGELFSGRSVPTTAALLMTLGVVTLMLTPYTRVVASALYFAMKKDSKYVFITVFVLIMLTVSLILH